MPEAPLRVLVIDDDEHMLLLARTLLGAEGFEVRTAVDGVEGLELASGFHPNVIVTDILMPRMGGIELYRNVRHDPELERIPFLFVTSYPESLRAIDSLLRSSDRALQKPVDLRQLVQEVRELGKLRRGDPEPDGS